MRFYLTCTIYCFSRSGRWKSEWTIQFQGKQAKVEGTIAVMAHYYEKGNVQMHNVKDVKASNIAGDVSVLCHCPPLVAMCGYRFVDMFISLFSEYSSCWQPNRVDGNCWRDAVARGFREKLHRVCEENRGCATRRVPAHVLLDEGYHLQGIEARAAHHRCQIPLAQPQLPLHGQQSCKWWLFVVITLLDRLNPI